MGRKLDGDLIQQAIAAGHASGAAGQDLAAALFPRSDVQMTDRMIAHGRELLHNTVTEIEAELCLILIRELGLSLEIFEEIGDQPKGYSFSILQRSGLLQSEQIMQHLFLLLQRVEIQARLTQKAARDDLEAVLTPYLDHGDGDIADAAMALLVAQNRETVIDGMIKADIASLPSEILYMLTWPVAAALGELAQYEGPELAESASRLLSRHDEGASVQRTAHRLARLVEDEAGGTRNPHPLQDGADLFFARLAIRSGLSADQLISFSADPQMARLVAVMRALDLPEDQAISIFGSLERGQQLLTPASYQEIDQDYARQLVAQWAVHPLYQEARHKLAQHNAGAMIV